MNRHLNKEVPTSKKVAIIFLKLLSMLVLTGVIFYSHMSAYQSGVDNGRNEGAEYVAQYVYTVCSAKHANELILYSTKFHCGKLGSL